MIIDGINDPEEIRRILGDNPHPQALQEFTQQYIGMNQPLVIELGQEYPYTVTLHRDINQENFYDEMESAGSRGYVPERVVECSQRMPMCRSTEYLLTPEEAAGLELDPRVMAVEIDPQHHGIRARPLVSQYSAGWDKTGNLDPIFKNWGLFRQWFRRQIPNWGGGGQQDPTQAGTITLTSTGKNVDVVVFDGNIDPAHPEYQRNADGTGGTRVNQFNWWSLNPQVTGQAAGTYNYTAGVAGNNGHGFHVAGIFAGNTQGWARDSTIYNISPYGEQTNGTSTPSLTQLVNYIRYWHNNIKTVNPETGVKNPTVVNMSFGLFGNQFARENGGRINVNQLYYRGVTQNYPASAPPGQSSLQVAYNGNWTPQQWYNAGVQLYSGYIDAYGVILYFYTAQDTAAEQAIIDGVNEGIIWCAAAGNQWNEAGFFSDHPNYVNYVNQANAVIGSVVLYRASYHNRMPVPASAESGRGTANFKTICVVGNISVQANQSLSQTSSAGNKVTVWAPGENIMSAYNAAGIPDPRNAAFYITKLTGTSMASPQIAGIIACMAELYPDKRMMDYISWINAYANLNNVPDLGIPLPPGPVSNFGLREAPNVFGLYYNDRPINGNTWPQKRWWIRPTQGLAYPRQTIRRRSTVVSTPPAPAADRVFTASVRTDSTAGPIIATTGNITITG
jgi:hypothetical protein